MYRNGLGFSGLASYCIGMNKTAPTAKKVAKKAAKRTKKKRKLEHFPAGVTLAPAKHPRYSFVVRWPGPDGKRLHKWFTNRTDALTHVKEKSAEAGEVGTAFGSIFAGAAFGAVLSCPRSSPRASLCATASA